MPALASQRLQLQYRLCIHGQIYEVLTNADIRTLESENDPIDQLGKNRDDALPRAIDAV